MLKKEGTITSNRVSLGLKCGECIHFQKGPARFEKLCTQLGIQSFSEACPEYTPDLYKIASVEDDVMAQMANIAAKLSGPQARIFAYLFRNIDFIKKAGFEFGQVVVFSISGKDILDNYVRGKVVFADRTGETIHITSDLEKLNTRPLFVSLLRPNVMTVDEFKKHRQKLVKEGRIVEPKPSKSSNKRTLLQCLKMSDEAYEVYMSKLRSAPEEYVPPMLDTVPHNWIDQRSVESLLESKVPPKLKKGLPNAIPRKAVDGKFKIDRYATKAPVKR